MISQMLQTKMKREQREQERRPAQAVGPDRLQDDALADEVDDRLGDVLHAASARAAALRPATKKNGEHDAATDSHISSTTLLTANGPLAEQVGPLDEVADRRELEGRAITTVGPPWARLRA